MDLAEVIKKRRSIRKYPDWKVENDKLDWVFDADRLCPLPEGPPRLVGGTN